MHTKSEIIARTRNVEGIAASMPRARAGWSHPALLLISPSAVSRVGYRVAARRREGGLLENFGRKIYDGSYISKGLENQLGQ